MTLKLWARSVSGGVWALLLCLPARAERPPIKAESFIELPKYTVTDSRPLPKPEAWRYTEFNGFEVLSNTSDRNTRRTVEDFRRFENALNIVWPALQQKSQVPVTLLLCDKGKFGSFVPDSAKINDGVQGAASVLLDHGPRSAIVLDMGTSVLNLNAEQLTNSALASSGVIVSGIEVDQGEQLKREYIHLLFSRLKPRVPAWFEEGLAQLLRGMEVDDRRIRFAKLEDPNEISFEQSIALQQAQQNTEDEISQPVYATAEDRGFQAALHRSALMGFPELFAVKRESSLAKNPIGSSWAKQCYAFVHMCLYGSDKRYQKGMLTFVGRLAKEPPSEALFKECFGTGYRSMGASLRGYVEGASYRSVDFVAHKGEKFFSDQAPLAIRDATQAEVGRIKGETYLLAGHPEAAQIELITAYRRGEREARLLASLGLFEETNGDKEKAKKFLRAAVAQKVVRPEAYLSLARSDYADALKAAGGRQLFTQEETQTIIGLLRTAARQPPLISEVYEIFADTWQRSPVKIDRADTVLLVRASNQFPAHLRLIYQTAGFCAETHLLKEAHALADHGIAYAPDEETKRSFTALKSSLPALPPPAKAG